MKKTSIVTTAARSARARLPIGLALWLATATVMAAPLRLSVYATAGDVQQSLSTPADRERVLRLLRPLHVSRLFLEGRRGDEYVAPDQLREVRDFFQTHGIDCTGGIATVPGRSFGLRQTGGLDWLNWESDRTRTDVHHFFAENAPLFRELIVDDFFCTGDISPVSDQARGRRSWSQYRRDLLVSLIPSVIVEPARQAHPDVRLILKFPQWYDRFHVFGYDPARMPAWFDQVWVGTEVRDPQTRRMGYVQPTEGYMNFRWLSATAGRKTRGAWFDHIECSAQNFIDQAYQSVLAGASELTLFHLGDILAGHPGDALLTERWPELLDFAARVRQTPPRGLAFYKPPGSDGDANLYLADYLGMVGLPIVPVAAYPLEARVVFLPAHAAADPVLLSRMRRHLERGATLVCTPALIRALGPEGAILAGVATGPRTEPTAALDLQVAGTTLALDRPLEIDGAVRPTTSTVRIGTGVNGGSAPWLTRCTVGRGRVLMLNVRTFSAADFGASGEWLLAPQPHGLPEIPQALADELRSELLAPLAVELRAPARVGLYLFGPARCLYNFRNTPAQVILDGRSFDLPANRGRWCQSR